MRAILASIFVGFFISCGGSSKKSDDSGAVTYDPILLDTENVTTSSGTGGLANPFAFKINVTIADAKIYFYMADSNATFDCPTIPDFITIDGQTFTVAGLGQTTGTYFLECYATSGGVQSSRKTYINFTIVQNFKPVFVYSGNENLDSFSGTGSQADPFTFDINEDTVNGVIQFAITEDSVNTIVCSDLPDFMTIDQDDYKITMTPLQSHVSTGNVFSCYATDNIGTSDETIYFSTDVINAEDTPTIVMTSNANVTTPSGSGTSSSPYAFDVNEDSSNGEVVFTLADEDGDATTLTCNSSPSWLTVDSPNSKITFSPVNADVATGVTFNCVANDGKADSDAPVYFSVNIVNTNDAPTIAYDANANVTNWAGSGTIGAPYDFDVNEDTSNGEVSFTLADVDVGDTVSIVCSGAPGFVSIDQANDKITFAPDNSHVGNAQTFSCLANDSTTNSTSSVYFSVDIINTNDTPTLAYDANANLTNWAGAGTIGSPYDFDVNEDTTNGEVSFTITDVDVGDTVSIVCTGAPSWLNIDDANDKITFSPVNADVATGVTWNCHVNDATTNSAETLYFSADVINTNDAPTIAYDANANVTNWAGSGTIGAPYDFDVNEDTSNGEVSFTLADVDVGDTVSIVCSGAPGFVSIDQANDKITFAPDNSHVGNAQTFSCLANDSTTNSTSSVYFSVDIINTNDTPTLAYDANANLTNWAGAGTIGSPYDFDVNEDTTNGEVSFTITDVDVGDTVSIVCTGAPSWLNIDDANDKITFSPVNADVATGVTWNCHVNDATTNSAETLYFSADVINTNDAPTIAYDANANVTNWAGSGTIGAPYDFDVNEDTSNGEVSFTLADVDVGDTVSIVCSGAPGFVSIDQANDKITFAPDNSHVGNAQTFSCLANDSTTNSTSSVYFSVDIINTNDTPTLAYDANANLTNWAGAGTIGSPYDFDVNEDTTNGEVSFTITDVDVGDTVSIVCTGAPSWLNIDDANDKITFSPVNADVATGVTWNCHVNDATTNSAETLYFSADVINTNDAPTIAYDANANVTNWAGSGTIGAPYDFDVNEDTSNGEVSFTLADVDVGDTVSIVCSGAPGFVSIDQANDKITFAPDNSHVGNAQTFSCLANDSTTNSTSSVYFSVDIINTNDIPTFSYSANANTTNWAGSGTIGTPYDFDINEDTTNGEVSFTITDVDVGDTVNIVCAGAPGFVSIDQANDKITFAPDNSHVGNAQTFSCVANDTTADSATTVYFSIDIINTNDLPVFTYNANANVSNFAGSGTIGSPYDFDVNEDTTNGEVSFTITDDDSGDVPDIVCTGGPSWLTLDQVNDKITFNPVNADVASAVTFNCHANDGTANSSSTIYFSIDVINTNDTPTLAYDANANLTNWAGAGTIGSPYDFDVNEDTTNGEVSFTITDVDVGDTVSIVCTGAPSWLNIDDANDKITFSPVNADVATGVTWNCHVNDATTNSAETLYFSADVINTNDAPTIAYDANANVSGWSGAGTIGSPYAYSATEDTSNGEISFTLADVDVGDSLTLACTGEPAYVSLDQANDKITFSPTQAHVGGPVNFSCNVSDGTANSVDSIYFSASVSNVNDIPTISYSSNANVSNWAGSGTSGTPYTFDLSIGTSDGNVTFTIADDDGDTPTLNCGSPPGFVVIDDANDRVTFSPDASHIGDSQTFSCLVNDGTANSSTSVYFSADVNDINFDLHDGTAAVFTNDPYGTKGTGSTSNLPTMRNNHTLCTDSSGDHWIYGGKGFGSGLNHGYLGDLWKYEIANGKWTYVSGSQVANTVAVYGTQGTGAAANTPGGREQTACGFDSNGDFILFGGYNGSYFNDLWKYDVSAGNWIWVEGSSSTNQTGVYGTKGTGAGANIPGGRMGAQILIDSLDYVWVFGGYAYDSAGTLGITNDLWQWDGTNWIWQKGASTVNGSGTYGTEDVANAANTPGATYNSSGVGIGDKLYLFGGEGYDGSGNLGSLNALWMLDVSSTAVWTWISGSSSRNGLATYGSQGVSDAANIPGCRKELAMSKDSNGDLWTFGGYGRVGSGGFGNLSDLWFYDVSADEWTWKAGDNSLNVTAVPGTKSVANAANKPGYTKNAVVFADSSGNTFVFGGEKVRDDALSYETTDKLWKWDGSNWTWAAGDTLIDANKSVLGTKGTPASSNKFHVGDHVAFTVDSSDNLIGYGGFGYDKDGSMGSMGTLLEYDGADWTWLTGSDVVDQHSVPGTINVSNSANYPGARYGSAAAPGTNAGEFYILGGYGQDSDRSQGHFNDLWFFDGTDWTWKKGSSSKDGSATYGTKGVAATSNTPGGRTLLQMHKDSSNNLWAFGGTGYDSASTLGSLNDLWKFDGTDWMWVSGGNTVDASGVYGTKAVANGSNVPGSRKDFCSIMDSSNNLWIFGGYGFDESGNEGSLSDLWKYDGTDWTWMAGSKTIDSSGTYGTRGKGESANEPPSRKSCGLTVDSSGELWLFGGVDSSNETYSDLWRFDGTNWAWMHGASSTNVTMASLGAGNTGNTPGGTRSSAIWVDTGYIYIAHGVSIDGSGDYGTSRAVWKLLIP